MRLHLSQAAKHGHAHLIDGLLIYGCPINDQNAVGNTPLHVAATHGQVCLFHFSSSCCITVLH